jgi:small subunit ribosomal protein S6
MRPYEIMVVFDSALEEDAVRSLADRFSKQLTGAGAKSVRTDSWGKRRLAYPIKHRNEGYYVLFEATSEPAPVLELDRLLTLSDEVIRHKVMRLPERAAGRTRPAASSEAHAPAAASTNGA